ncbi:DUF6653 family protein [Haloarcula laminariae]|uniref:DUF6653 family protein n=1 Tax=Haloarcula laminariae TaxID=2961577 RepID=UPI0024058740|nr:DUF6653 family protein [Halomicroarcula sp. FL173]
MPTAIPDDDPLDRYFWARHANPRSGWSRVPTLPLIVACIYRRNWRGLALTLAFVAVNPFLFSPPEDDSAWMTRGVYGERLWAKQAGKHRRYPGLLNVPTALASLYALYAAIRQRPAETAAATALAMTLKLWFVSEMVHLYEDGAGEASTGR